MSNFKFHLVTVVGVFLALALGIFIGSTFTEEGIIVQQRDTIERMRTDIDNLFAEKHELLAQADKQAETMTLLQNWLGGMTDFYWQAHPVEKQVWLVHNGDFQPKILGSYLLDNVVGTRIQTPILDAESAQVLARAIADGSYAEIDWGEAGVNVEGNWSAPDYVLLAINPGQDAEVSRIFVDNLLAAEIPVISLGLTGWEGLADLADNPLYSSVSHLDTPLGLYCLGAILQGQGGHYGLDNLLPTMGVNR